MTDIHTLRQKPRLILISPTAGTLAQFERAGFLKRQLALINEYGKHFQVDYYTSDVTDYSSLLTVKHHPLPIKFDIYGLRHLLFWLFLVIKAPGMNAPIRTFGVEIPTLPLVRILARHKVITGYEWDYASTTRANYSGIKRWLANFIQACGFRGTDLVICTTDRLKGMAENNYQKKAVVIPNFVDFNVFNKSHQKEDQIVYAGRLHWSKGVEVLLSVFKEIVRDFPGYRLIICGTGDLESSLKQRVTTESIPNVEFLGSVEQDRLAQYMAKAKVFVLPSLTSEGHPRVLIEAMASGTACVATRVPGNTDVITDNVNGLLVDPRDPSSMFQAISRILWIGLLEIELVGVLVGNYLAARPHDLHGIRRLPEGFVAPVDHNGATETLVVNKSGADKIFDLRRVDALKYTSHDAVRPVQKVDNEVDAVRSELIHATATSLSAPSPARFRVLQDRRTVHFRAEVDHLTDDTIREKSPHLHKDLIKPIDVSHLVHKRFLSQFSHDGLPFGRCHCKRFLDEHMNASSQTRPHDLRVRVARRGDDHAVEV